MTVFEDYRQQLELVGSMDALYALAQEIDRAHEEGRLTRAELEELAEVAFRKQAEIEHRAGNWPLWVGAILLGVMFLGRRR